MTTKEKPQKKVRVKSRHKRVSEEFKKWMEKNPKASHAEIHKAFDMYCDSAILDEEINGPHT